MSKNKLPKIGGKQIGQNFNATITDEDGTVKALPIRIADKEAMKDLKNKIASYGTKPTKKLHDEIVATLTPQTTKEKVEKEEKVTKVKATVKKLKNAAKSIGKSVTGKKTNSKESSKKKVKVSEKQVEEIKEKVEAELPIYRRYKGYKHPVTGQTWNGERYV